MGKNRPLKYATRARLDGRIRGNRRETLYKMKAKKGNGVVLCFVCQRHVAPNRSSLEHVIRKRDGGTDDMDNLDISHEWCNTNRDRIEAGEIKV